MMYWIEYVTFIVFCAFIIVVIEMLYETWRGKREFEKEYNEMAKSFEAELSKEFESESKKADSEYNEKL